MSVKVSKGSVKRIGEGKMWYIDVCINGKRIKEPKAETKSGALAALEAIKTDARRGELGFLNVKNITFEDYSNEYLESKTSLKEKSYIRLESSLGNLKPFFGDMLLSDITPQDIERYKKLRLEMKKKPATVNRELSCLNNMYTRAIGLEYLKKNPVEKVERCRVKKSDSMKIRICDRDEAQTLIDKAADYLKPVIITAFGTGMRKEEILSLRWENVDMDMLYINVVDTKNDKERQVPMNFEVQKAFESFEHRTGYVFRSPRNDTRLRDPKKGFKAACERAGIKGMRFHDLRHTAATWMVMAGIDLVTVKEILGHSDIKTTMIYAHPTPENKRRAVDALASVLAPEVQENRKIKEKPLYEVQVSPEKYA